MSEMVNPYIAGAPVVEAKMFFGREDVFDWIQNSLTGRYADHILVIHGQRRVGKTSVLKQLGNRLPKKYIPVFFDLQGRTHTTLDRFLWWLAREIGRVLKQERDITITVPEKELFASDLEYFETVFLPSVRSVLGEQSLLLTFDEFDNLEESEVRENLAGPLIDYLRRLMGEQGLNFIFSIGSSGNKLENMRGAYTDFFKTALYKKISFLSKEQSVGLVTRPVEGLLEYDRKATERIFDIASGHPYFTQLTCHELFSTCQRTGELRIRESDVESILDDVVERGTVNLKYTWDEASDIEKWSLATLAHEKQAVDNRAIADSLRRQRVRFSESDLTSGVLHLREKDILTEQNRFVVYLLKLWLKKNRPMEQVREELTEINPIANRYIEIGLEFHDSGQYEKAIENFREALEVAPEHVQAQVNIGLSYIAQKNFAQAVIEFEKGLAIDDEEVTARSGLCTAQMALGDAARDKGKTKDALLSYQKVLSINAEHTEARQRMAEISRQRAEKAIADGRDEEALAAFAEALKYTPEDENLSTRYEQAKVEKRTKVLVSLLAKAEKAQSARDWNTALSILNNALELDAESEQALSRLAAVQAAQREEQLQSILARAERAVSAARWGLVIAALEEYLTLEPGDEKVRARIDEARGKLHEAQVNEAVSEARTLTRQERWGEAVTAWGEVLKIAPEEGETVQAEIEKIQKAEALAKTYLEAQTALAKKNYNRATSLFKEIVVQDENYRDSSRRMAEAIELRRTARPWWKTKWFLGGAGLATIGLLAFGLSRLWNPLLSALEPSTVTPKLASTATITPTTLPPTATATALPLTWARLNSGQFLPRDQITAIVIDPSDPGVMYVGTENAGAYKSIDGGRSWQPAHNGLERANISTLIIDPENPSTLYAGVVIGGIYKTIDGAQNWFPINSGIELPGGEWLGIVVMDPLDSRHLYFTQRGYLYESLDAGEEWRIVQLPACTRTHGISNLAVHPNEGKTIFIMESNGGGAFNCPVGIYKSEDGGTSWTQIPVTITGEEVNYKSLAIDNRNPNNIFFSEHLGTLHGSFDGGSTWEILMGRGGCSTVAFDPTNQNRTYCGGVPGLWKSEMPGSGWSKVNIPEDYYVTAIAFSPLAPKVLLAGGAGLYVSLNDGKSWGKQDSGLGGSIFQLKIDPAKDSTIYGEDSASQSYISTDNGHTWNQSQTDSSYLNPAALTVGQCQPFGYFSSDKQTGYGVGCMAWDSFRTNDGGTTWEECDQSANRDVWVTRSLTRLVIDLRDNNKLIIASRGNGVLISKDGCQSWEFGNDGLGSLFVNTLAIDPNNPDTVYAGTDGGAFISSNFGETWNEINDGLLGATVVYSIVVDKGSNVYAATPYGIFKLEGK